MPDSRPAQTYSTLLEDRRIIESAAEANESPSLIVHLLEKDWSIRPGRAPNNAGARRFSYSEPISGLLDDIQARRIPVEFTDIFKKLDVKFFEGCLIVEMHDSRPTKGGPSKNVEARIDKYVLRPTAESLWAEIRNVVDGQQGWGDKEALELEARIVLATAPPLCLDPSPTVNRIANVITRIGAYPTKTSLKRRQSEDTEDDIDSLKRRKLMQLMNPRVGKPFVPKYRALMHKDAASQRPPVEPTTVPTTITNGGSVVATSSTMAQGLQLRPNVPPTATTAAAPTAQPVANVAQAGLAARPRPMPLKIGPDAQHAATLSLAARNRISAAQNLVAAAQGGRPLPQVAGQVAAAIVNAAVTQGNTNPSVGNTTNNVTNQDALSQFAAQQPGKPPISLTMPTVIKRSSAASSPPKVSALPAGPSNPPSQINTNNAPPNPSATPVPPTPQMQPSTPQMANQTPVMHPTQIPSNTQAVNQLTSYHQNVANGQQNQMHSAAAAGLNGARPPYAGFVNPYQGAPQVNRPTTAQMLMQNGMHPQMMASLPAYQAALQQQQQQQRINAITAQRQQLIQMNNGMNLQAQMPAGYNGNMPPQQPVLNHFKILQTAEERVAKMAPPQLAALAASAPPHLQAMSNWHSLTDFDKAKLHMRHAIELSARAALQRGVGRPPADGSTAQPQMNR